LFEVHDDGVGGERNAKALPRLAHPVEPIHGIFKIIVIQVFDRASESNSLFGRPDGIGIESNPVARHRGRERPITFEIVFKREDAALELVRSKAVSLLQRSRVLDDLLDRADGALAVRVRITEEDVRGERDAIAHPAAEDVADRYAPRLTQQIKARELERRHDLGPVVVERGGWIGEHEAHLFQPRRIAAHERRSHRQDSRDRRLAAAAHFAETDQAGVAFDLHDRSDEAAPMAAVRMPQRRLQRHRYRRCADV
jgi:hypothetical protein